jgi:anti-anti-sigma factor
VEDSVSTDGQDAVISRCHTPGAVVITVSGEIDCLDADGLVECVSECATEFDDELVLDFSDISFISVSVLGRLVALRDRLAAQGRAMRLRAPANRVGRYFALVGL